MEPELWNIHYAVAIGINPACSAVGWDTALQA